MSIEVELKLYIWNEAGERVEKGQKQQQQANWTKIYIENEVIEGIQG